MSGTRQVQHMAAPQTLLSAPLYHAMVLETGQGFKVRPAQAQVHGELNPFFRLKNNTSHSGWLALPPQVTGGQVVPPVAFGPHSWIEVELHGGGAFSYVVILITDQGFVSVTGESDPVIIIDPPAN